MSHGSKKFLRQIVSVTHIPEHWDTFTICSKIFITRKGENVYKSIIIYSLLMVYEAIIDLNMKVQ